MTYWTGTAPEALRKTLTGITGLDEITQGGLPQGRPTLVFGAVGSGKTLLAMEFLVRGILDHGEPGVFVAFEETSRELAQNMASLGFPIEELIARGQLIVDHIRVDPHELVQVGEYDLDGLLIRLGHAIQRVQAKRVVLDTLEVLFGALGDTHILRVELHRLFAWLKSQGVTTIITAERREGASTRHGIEEYVSDCVILLDHRIEHQLSTRRLRVLKYRGSQHGSDEYPFLIDEGGISVLPITSIGLTYPVSEERVASGIPALDVMLGGQGFYRGSTVLISGPSGSGKTLLLAHFVDAACRRHERCMFFSFEEPPQQVMRNVRSVGLDLQHWVQADLLRFHAARPTMYNLEEHLVRLYKLIREYDPQVVVFDPVTAFEVIGEAGSTRSLLTRLIDFLKTRGITAVLTSLTRAGEATEQTEVNISSLVDTWILIYQAAANGEHNRLLYVLKSRGMAHSNQISEFRITSNGIEILQTPMGGTAAMTGAARLAQQRAEAQEALELAQAEELKRLRLAQRRAELARQIEAMQAALEDEQALAQLEAEHALQRRVHLAQTNQAMAQQRQAPPPAVQS